jgi:hypothetical protein
LDYQGKRAAEAVTPAKAPGIQPIDAVYIHRGRDELRFSLRSLDRHAPWIRKVHLVTGGDPPAWIGRGQERVDIVRQEDLRVSSPDAAAWQLFRIPGISQQFLYLEENHLLGSRLKPEDFLTAKGGRRFYVEATDIPPGSVAESLLNSRFGNRSPRKTVARTPRFLDRSFLEEVNRLWEKPIKQSAVSLETLYFYYLVECPQQYGIHEEAAVTPGIYRSVPVSSSLAATLAARPRFFSLDGADGAGPPMLLKMYYWRRSSFEK